MAEDQNWTVTDVFLRGGTLHVVALGAIPEADPADLRDDLDAAGLEDTDVEVTLIVGGSKLLAGN